nr:methyl-accepting chemotaxis protein [Halomonas sp. 1513]
MTVRVSWGLVLAMFALLVVLLSGLGLYAVNHGQGAMATFNQVNVDQQSTLNRANSQLLSARLAMADVGDALEFASGRREVDAARERATGMAVELERVDATFSEFLALPAREEHAALIADVETSYRALMEEGLRPQQSALAGNDVAAYLDLQADSNRLTERFYADSVAFFHTAEAEGAALYDGFYQIADLVKYAIIAVLLVSAATIVVVLWGVTVNVIRPLKRVVAHFEQMAKGDLSAAIERRGNNEIGQLFASLKHMQEGLSTTVSSVRSSSQSIFVGAQEIAQGNNDLSARTEQQAASIEETASSMEQLTATVSQNADNARQASQLASTASQTASRGGEVVGDVVSTMREISDSSHQVTEIIKVIDSIAFQTNILALNASVEAARAGEQGRGFAVVAGEVRNLAGRSGDAASEIRKLIEASVNKVEAGTALVDQAGKTMDEIVASVHKVTDIMDEIASASQEQSNGIGQVNQAITQLDQVTQQNAALVQQAAGAASELELESSRLREAVAAFRLAQGAEQASGARLEKSRPALGAPRQAASAPASRQPEAEWETF